MSVDNHTTQSQQRVLQEVSRHQQDDQSKQAASPRSALLRSEKSLKEVDHSGPAGETIGKQAMSHASDLTGNGHLWTSPHLETVSGEIDAHGMVQADSARSPLMRSERRQDESGNKASATVQSSAHELRVVSPSLTPSAKKAAKARPGGSASTGSGAALLRSEKKLHEVAVHPSGSEMASSSLLLHPEISDEMHQPTPVQAEIVRRPIMRSEKLHRATPGDSQSQNVNLHLFDESSGRQPETPTSVPQILPLATGQALPVSPLVASAASSVAASVGQASVTPAVAAPGLASASAAPTVASPTAVSRPVAPAPLSTGAPASAGAASISPSLAPNVAGYNAPSVGAALPVQAAAQTLPAYSAVALPWSPAYSFPAAPSVPLITTPPSSLPSESRHLAASDVMINSTLLPMAEATSTAHKVAAMMGLFFIFLLAVVGVMLVRQITALTEFRSKSSLKSKSSQPKTRPSRVLKFHQTSKRAQEMLEARQDGQLIPPGALLNEALTQAGISLDDPSIGLAEIEAEIRDKTCEMRLVRDPATLETKLIRFVRLLRIKVLLPSTKGSSTLELFELSRDTTPMTDMLLPLQDRHVRHEDTRGPLTVKVKLHEKDLYSLCQQVLFERLELEFDWQDKCLLREEDESNVFVEERESKNHPSLFTWYQIDEYTVVVDRQRALKEPGSYLGLPDNVNFQTSCSRTGNHIFYSWEWQRQTSERSTSASKRMTVTSLQAADSDVRIIDATALTTQRTISCSEDSVPMKKTSSVRSSITSQRMGTRRSLAAAARDKRRERNSIASAVSSKAGSSSDSDK